MKKYTKETKVHPCRLTRSDLVGLEEVIRSDIKTERTKDFKVTCHIPNIDISENSINDFLNHKDLPRIISRISLSIIGWSEDNNIDKSVDLIFYDSFITLRVSGTSETWVNGKFLQVVNLLRTKRPALWFLKTTPVYMLRGSLFAILFYAFGVMLKRLLSEGLNSIGISLPILIVAISLFDTALSKFNYTEIYIEEKKSFIEKYNTAILIIGAIGSIAAIISVILQILT